MSRHALAAARFTACIGCLAALCTAAPCFAWMNPTRDRIDDGNHLFKQGKYDEALAKYGDVLVDHPESPLLNFNMGDANYKAGKYAEAIASFTRVRPDEQDPTRLANAAYNVGNAEYRLAAAAEAEKPQDALKGYAAALVAYRRALGADSTDHDAKFNYEYVTKKIEDLKKKLEEQQKQQDQQKDQPQDQQKQNQQQQADQKQDQQPDQQQQPSDQQQQQPADQKDAQQQQAEQKEPQQQQAQQSQQDKDAQQQPGAQQAEQEAGGQKDDEQTQAAAQAAGDTGVQKTDKMSRQEAAALIDTAKDDELRPDEFVRQVQGGRVAEPAQDW